MPTSKGRRSPAKTLPGVLQDHTHNGHRVMRVQARKLQPADYNPRSIKKRALSGLKHSVGRFGMVQSVVWNDRTGNVVGGHQRLKTVAPDTELDVVVVSLSLAEEKALNLALNNGAISGDWTANLAQVIEEVRLELPDLSDALLIDDLNDQIPSEIDDLLDELDGDQEGPSQTPAGGGSEEIEPNPSNETEWEDDTLKQIVLVMTEEEYAEADAALKKLQKRLRLDSPTAVVLHLLRKST